MKISSQLKGGIYDVSFRYNTNLGGYTTLMSDIPKLYAIDLGMPFIKLVNKGGYKRRLCNQT
uniref:Uncharacterized protein n=1 Tax=Candidatus Methanophaga sp. ANME-1 ERB7 TaxID=2759913 RepID=A0A7G9Z735_9EURY|nr:hypothetical protein GIJIEOGM_00010 [Methanosarcinales archaeon ANME-1 ERB7]